MLEPAREDVTPSPDIEKMLASACDAATFLKAISHEGG